MGDEEGVKLGLALWITEGFDDGSLDAKVVGDDDVDGAFVGISLKTTVGLDDGSNDAKLVGDEDGSFDATTVGGEDVDGALVGTWLKSDVGVEEGFDDETEVGTDDAVGVVDGWELSSWVGVEDELKDGGTVGLLVSLEEGTLDGFAEFVDGLLVVVADANIVGVVVGTKNGSKVILLLPKIDSKRAISNRNLLVWMNAIIVTSLSWWVQLKISSILMKQTIWS